MTSEIGEMGVTVALLIFTGINSPLGVSREQETAGVQGVSLVPGVSHILVTAWMGSLRFGSEN